MADMDRTMLTIDCGQHSSRLQCSSVAAVVARTSIACERDAGVQRWLLLQEDRPCLDTSRYISLGGR